MDAMLAANTMKEPRKRKRKVSTSRESGPSDAKKDATGGSPSHSPKGEDNSPSSIKPTFKVKHLKCTVISLQNLLYISKQFFVCIHFLKNIFWTIVLNMLIIGNL